MNFSPWALSIPSVVEEESQLHDVPHPDETLAAVESGNMSAVGSSVEGVFETTLKNNLLAFRLMGILDPSREDVEKKDGLLITEGDRKGAFRNRGMSMASIGAEPGQSPLDYYAGTPLVALQSTSEHSLQEIRQQPSSIVMKACTNAAAMVHELNAVTLHLLEASTSITYGHGKGYRMRRKHASAKEAVRRLIRQMDDHVHPPVEEGEEKISAVIVGPSGHLMQAIPKDSSTAESLPIPMPRRDFVESQSLRIGYREVASGMFSHEEGAPIYAVLSPGHWARVVDPVISCSVSKSRVSVKIAVTVHTGMSVLVPHNLFTAYVHPDAE